ncbi:Zn-dependent peptidase ImmA (M78 family) [Mycetocola sp. BIGb0189]|uniref:ImmA/IrrE family metallo-endopeptidase n=1 Tax=Mycetocola sp. BIGb0189 TaxID=2940604 RepID=UPI002169B507|nr:ImmA/IrrE family metallo-endopeptidase [Mycetocola sp. BIGb0189]MCS4276754.1 Zn-dependent peptidase ImmA (M78 family) [Mycetocola sp. BIGb0189]
MYDPYAHAEALGVAVLARRIGAPTGLWVPRLRVIFVRPGLTARHERSVVAHEVAHVVLGHSATSRKEERAADALAARNLIEDRRFAEVARWTQQRHELAVELGVTERILGAYLDERERHAGN